MSKLQTLLLNLTILVFIIIQLVIAQLQLEYNHYAQPTLVRPFSVDLISDDVANNWLEIIIEQLPIFDDEIVPNTLELPVKCNPFSASNSWVLDKTQPGHNPYTHGVVTYSPTTNNRLTKFIFTKTVVENHGVACAVPTYLGADIVSVNARVSTNGGFTNAFTGSLGYDILAESTIYSPTTFQFAAVRMSATFQVENNRPIITARFMKLSGWRSGYAIYSSKAIFDSILVNDIQIHSIYLHDGSFVSKTDLELITIQTIQSRRNTAHSQRCGA